MRAEKKTTSWHVTRDVPRRAPPLSRPPRLSGDGPAATFPRRAAEAVASPRQMEPPALPPHPSTPNPPHTRLATKGGVGSERRRWEWPPAAPLHHPPHTPVTDARRRPRLRRDPAGRVLGWNRCHLSPSIPLCQHLGGGAGALFLSSLLLIRTPGRCRAQPSPSPTLSSSSIKKLRPPPLTHTQCNPDAGLLSRLSTSCKLKPHTTE